MCRSMVTSGFNSEHGVLHVTTIPFDTFWSWLMRHPNCIVRAGTPEAVIYDDEDLHWHFAVDGPLLYLQVIRGKRLMGELAVDSERIAYVEAVGEEPEGEHLFEFIAEGVSERTAAYSVVLSHGYEEEETPAYERAVH